MNTMLLALALTQEAVALPGDALLDERGATLYVSGAEGKVEAVDAAAGRLKWTSATSGRVLALSGGTLAVESAAADVVRILILDAGTGALLSTSPAIPLPDWAWTTPANGKGFRAKAKLVPGRLVYDWEATASYAGGAAPSPEMEKSSRKHAAGRATIDLAGMTLTSAAPPPDALTALYASPPAEVKAGSRTYKLVEEPVAGRPFRKDRRLLCVPSDPSEAGWSRPLPPRLSPIPMPSAR